VGRSRDSRRRAAKGGDASGTGAPEHLIRTRKIVNAAGAWSPEIAKLVGVELPNKPHRHEICSTEPLKPWLKPLVADLENGLYFSQSTRGEIVGGIVRSACRRASTRTAPFAFLGLYAKALVATCPVLGKVKVLRQWSGCYDLTPDGNPIVGGVDAIEHFYQASGFMGHGFMMAPVMGKLIAEHIAKETTSRCSTGEPAPLQGRQHAPRGEAMIIG